MALKAVHVSDVPNLDQVPESPSVAAAATTRLSPKGGRAEEDKPKKFVLIGHRGKGMNALASPDRRLRAIKENTIRSFNEAARFPLVDFVEFDAQVTKDGCPIVFHDNFILTEENGIISERRVTELRLEEFLSYGPQQDSNKKGKSLHRKAKDGRVSSWSVEADDPLCTLQEVFQHVDSRLGFNIELKFDDHLVYQEEELTHCLQMILRVVFEHAKDRSIIFSSFQPDAAQLMRKLQSIYPVFFLTNGGNEVYTDQRRNSLEDAIKLCLETGLQGIVSEVRGVFRSPSLIPKIKESKLTLLTYGQLNNVSEAVYMQHLMGVDGVIVDLVEEITEAVSDFITPAAMDGGEGILEGSAESEGGMKVTGVGGTGPKFSQRELNFLLKLIPELVQR